MIKIGELRIGNYVIKNNKNAIIQAEICRVFVVHEDSGSGMVTFSRTSKVIDGNNIVDIRIDQNATYTSHQSQVTCDSLKPINLTENVFLKCGFRKADDCFCYDIYKFMFRDTRNGYSLEKGGYSIVTIRTLHQLQNLYFALTGEELEIQL